MSFRKTREAGMHYLSEIEAFEGFLETWANVSMKRSAGIFGKAKNRNAIYVVDQMPSMFNAKAKGRVFALLKKYSGYDYAMKHWNGTKYVPQKGKSRLVNPYASRPPLVILHTIYDAPTIYSSLLRSFPHDILVGRFISILEMRPITQNRIERVLKGVVSSWDSREARRGIETHQIKTIAEKANGDLKQALQQLEFLHHVPRASLGVRPSKKRKLNSSLHDISDSDSECTDDEFLLLSDGGSSVRQKSKQKTKRRKSSSSSTTKKTAPVPFAPNTSTRDNYFEVFHAAGKLLYGRRKSNGDFDFDLNNLMHQVHSTEDSLMNYVYHNMLSHYQQDAISDVANTLETFAFADSFSSRTSRDYALQKSTYPAYSFQIASRGILYHNKHREATKNNLIRAPCIVKVQMESEKSKEEGSHLFGLSKDEDMSLVDRNVIVQEIIPSQRLMHPAVTHLTPEQRSYLKKHQYSRSFSQVQNVDEELESSFAAAHNVPHRGKLFGHFQTHAEEANRSLPEAIESDEESDYRNQL